MFHVKHRPSAAFRQNVSRETISPVRSCGPLIAVPFGKTDGATRVSPVASRLFADAERGEQAVEDLVHVNAAGDLAERPQRQPDILRRELGMSLLKGGARQKGPRPSDGLTPR